MSDAAASLTAVEELRVLCAHRRGPFGVTGWVPRIEKWLGPADVRTYAGAAWQVGRPVMVTRNDHQLRIYNGDIGVVITTDDGPQVAFPNRDKPIRPSRLEAVETVHAMTIHKSQGSQFSHSVVVLPTEDSLILSRELVYTGVTRAVDRVTVIASEPAIRAGVERQVCRASGLRDRLGKSARKQRHGDAMRSTRKNLGAGLRLSRDAKRRILVGDSRHVAWRPSRLALAHPVSQAVASHHHPDKPDRSRRRPRHRTRRPARLEEGFGDRQFSYFSNMNAKLGESRQ